MSPKEQSIVQRVLAGYGLGPGVILPPQRGYRNRAYPILLETGAMANLILYKSEAGILRRIRNANRVSNFLADRSFPTRRTLSPAIARLSSSQRDKYGSVYSYLPGATIPWEAYTVRRLKLLGATLSNLHAALRSLPQARQTLPSVTGEYLAIVQRMQLYFTDPRVIGALSEKLGLSLNFRILIRYERLLQAAADLPGQQALHMDFVRSNILFADDSHETEISGILDFEKTAYGHPLFDIARTLAFLLVDCKYKPEAKIRKYFLYSGYHKRGRMPLPKLKLHTSSGTLELLSALTNLFLTYDLYKFLRHNPYEFLDQNEHFVRTRDILINQQLLARETTPKDLAPSPLS